MANEYLELDLLLRKFYDNDEFVRGIKNLVCDNESKVNRLLSYINSNNGITSDHISQFALRLDLEFDKNKFKN